MARTEKDMPIWVLREKAPWRMKRGGYPGAWGGAWKRVGVDATLWWRGVRHEVKQELKVGREPEPTRTRSSVKYNVW